MHVPAVGGLARRGAAAAPAVFIRTNRCSPPEQDSLPNGVLGRTAFSLRVLLPRNGAGGRLRARPRYFGGSAKAT
jgi:hypothetical protein